MKSFIRSWYLVLEKIVKVPGTKGALSKMVLDQGIITINVNGKRLTCFHQGLFAPSFLCVFVTAASTLQGLPLSVCVQEIVG